MPTPNRTQESVPGPQWIMRLSDITDQSAALLLLTSLGFPESFYASMKSHWPVDGNLLMDINTPDELCQVVGAERMPPSGLHCDRILKNLRALQENGIERSQYEALEKKAHGMNVVVVRSQWATWLNEAAGRLVMQVIVVLLLLIVAMVAFRRLVE